MPVFFNGRLYVTPTTVSAVDDTALANRNPNVGNVLAIIGRSDGGKPNTALPFGNPVEARAALISGELLDAVEKAFDPSAETPAPSRVIAVRVNPATQAQLMLQGAGAVDVILLKSTDYGARNNQIRVKVETGTNLGKRLTTSLALASYTQDDVYRKAFSIQYGGAQATARMSITNSTLTLEAPNATVVATVDLATYDTVQELVDFLNTISGFTATVLDGNGAKPTLNGLDTVTNQDVKTALYTVRADLQAIVDWFNGLAEGFLDATRQTGAGILPSNIADTYLAGASNGTVISGSWADALTTLQAEDVRWLTVLTSDASIHAQLSAHVAFMSTVGRKERRATVGEATGRTVAQSKAAALAINSDRVSLVHGGYYDFSRDGVLTLYAPYMKAALIAAMAAGVSPGEPLTNKAMRIRGEEIRMRNPTDTDELINAGVLCTEETPTGFRVVQSISTWLTNDNFNRVEISTGAALDHVSIAWRQSLDVLRGQRGDPKLLARAVEISDSTLRLLSQAPPQGPGCLVGNAENPPYRNIQAKLVGDHLSVSAQVSPVIPNNYTTITIYAVPFTATATA